MLAPCMPVHTPSELKPSEKCKIRASTFSSISRGHLTDVAEKTGFQVESGGLILLSLASTMPAGSLEVHDT